MAAAFDGVPKVRKQFELLGEQLDALSKKQKAFQNSLGPTVTELRAIINTAQTLQNLVDAWVAHGGEAGAGTRPDKPATSERQNEIVISQLQTFENQIKSVMGPNNYFASLIGTAIQGIQTGYIAPGEAIAWLQNQFIGFSAGLMQEIADPKTSPAMRELDQELERLIASGALQ